MIFINVIHAQTKEGGEFGNVASIATLIANNYL
jgi:hypothetical protein